MTSYPLFFRSQQLDTVPPECYPRGTDMVRHWEKLGFVVNVPIVIG